jgi:hypothetical protein
MMRPSDWKRYEQVLKTFFSEVGNHPIVWHKAVKTISRFREGDNMGFEDIPMRALVGYNAFRLWPTDRLDESGISDKNYCNIYLNRGYLADQGWLTPDGNFRFDPGLDRFTITGIKWKPAGDTPLAQSESLPQFFMIILVKDHYPTHERIRP